MQIFQGVSINDISPRGLITLLLAGLLTTACSTPAGPEQAQAQDPQIVLRPFEAMRDRSAEPVACTLGFQIIHRPGIAQHSREILYRFGLEAESGKPFEALQLGGGPVELPRPDYDPRVRVDGRGNVVFTIELYTFSPCAGDQGVATLEIIIGDCLEGDCPPMIYQHPDANQVAVIRQARA
ncbi:MAG: hypothetical protein RQ741_09980 [Wenzhouxiangellaceae bacterium]|nr:hypothetical protein [Wenzhouxiangellaceae bacterium]